MEDGNDNKNRRRHLARNNSLPLLFNDCHLPSGFNDYPICKELFRVLELYNIVCIDFKLFFARPPSN